MHHESALLEREAPRSRLEDALAAARAGRGRVVSIEGEAGIGKTSLVLDFADAHRHDARVYVGGCEQLTTPESLGPLRDIARMSQDRFAISPTSQLGTFDSLLRLLTDGRGPSLLVIEDLHWADDSTLDLLRYLGRRIRNAPVLIVTTSRNDDRLVQQRLAALWANMPRDSRERIELHPLTFTSVAALAQAAGLPAGDLFELTGGNPFHVTEFLAAPDAGVPSTVRDATLLRVAKLSMQARRALELASIFPRQAEVRALRELGQDPDGTGIEENLQSGMLKSAGDALTFRHELARRAVYDAISPFRRRELHVAALEWLTRMQARAAELAHHAEHAGDVPAVLEHSIRAAEQATTLGAHRGVVEHLARALACGWSLPDDKRADLLEWQAESGEFCGAYEVALDAIAEAVAARRRVGDPLSLGNALRIAARLLWLQGRSNEAESHCEEALRVLREHPDTWQYAMALSGQSQLDMLAFRSVASILHGTEAMERAQRLGRFDIYLHAWTNVATSRNSVREADGVASLRAAVTEAELRQEPEVVPRMYSCITFIMANDRRYEGLFDDVRRGVAVSVARDNAPLEAYIRGCGAQSLVDLGRLREAVDEAEFVIYGPYPRGIARFTAEIALAKARLRLGEPEGDALTSARSLPAAQRDLMRRVPLAVLDAEALWLGLPRDGVVATLREVFDAVLLTDVQSWPLAESALWLAILGERVDMPEERLSMLSVPHQHHIAGRWREAAAAWADLGCPYEQAIALSAGEVSEQREALAIFDRMGAVPAAARLRREMRERGVRKIPRGPNARTRENPVGLTGRQSQVLALMAQGMGNAEIARRLYITEKTAEHHVSAVLARLGAASRREAVEHARQAGLIEPPET